MMSPRIIVRATVAALSVAFIAGSAFVAQAAEGSPDISEDHGLSSVSGTFPLMDNTSIALPSRSEQTASVRSNGAAAKTGKKAAHPNFRESRSRGAEDMKGAAPSAYTGTFYNAGAENYRACITKREAENVYAVVGGGDLDGDGNGDYQGAYQMSPALAEGVTWMMAKESKKDNDGLLAEVRALRDVPANEWSRYWQDRAFWTILNWDGDYSGAKHWAGGRWTCTPGM